ncbi:hypothetical protein [Rubrivirga sp. IMCC45206]|uniref:hypothetical protein n=1 Tax=Rubrivirga sp. IMCC45206 TaxID=3391614 RepID=UPI00399030F0
MTTATLPPSVPTGSRWRRGFHIALGVSWVAVAVPLLAWGLEYYLTPLDARPDHPGYDLFRPTGLVGNRLGVIGTGLLAFGVAVYIVRKRWTRLQGVGRLRDWLSFHIWCCTLGPFLVLLHTSFKVGGLVSIAFWSMVTVVASGVLGRYVYVHIPKAVTGRFLERDEIERERAALHAELAERYGAEVAVDAAPDVPAGMGSALIGAFRYDRASRRAVRDLRRMLAAAGVAATERAEALALARRSRRLALGAAVLQPFGRLFRYWHAVHLPLAIVMALVLLVHIAVAIAFGYAWT